MSKRDRPKYECTACKQVTSQWAGQCSSCGEWNTLVEAARSDAPESTGRSHVSGGSIIQMKRLDKEVTLPDRIVTGIAELDQVLGGGLVHGSAVVISGEPGIGKSTLLLQMIAAVAKTGLSASYISGEEHEDQVRLRAQRLGLGDAPVDLGHDTSVRNIVTTMAALKPRVLIVDSIQTMHSDASDSAPGSPSQIKASSDALISYAKSSGCAVIIVGHVTKDNALAGPRMLEHMVDAVLSFEGDRAHQYRLLRAVKNRFGATDEVGVFEMTELGLKDVKNPSSLFLVDRTKPVSGAAVLPTVEGGRSILVEVQALVVKRNDQGYPRRAAVGYDKSRLDMILAILELRYGLPAANADVYLNVAGGYRIADTAADMAVAAAIMSSFADRPLPTGSVHFGELALSGEVRPVAHTGIRLREAARQGFDAAICPKLGADVPRPDMRLQQIEDFAPIANSIYGVDN